MADIEYRRVWMIDGAAQQKALVLGSARRRELKTVMRSVRQP